MKLKQVQKELRGLYDEIPRLEKGIAEDMDLLDDDLAVFGGCGMRGVALDEGYEDLEDDRHRLSEMMIQQSELEEQELALLRDAEDQRTIRLIVLEEKIATLTESLAIYKRKVADGDSSARVWVVYLSKNKSGADIERASLVKKLTDAGLVVQ